jgi:hypothetical protein
MLHIACFTLLSTRAPLQCTNVWRFVFSSFGLEHNLSERNSISRSESGQIVTRCGCIISQSFRMTDKRDATPSQWNAPHIVALLSRSGDAGVVLLIETSSQIQRGHCNRLRREVHSRCIETCLHGPYYVRIVPTDSLNLRAVHVGSVGHQTVCCDMWTGKGLAESRWVLLIGN